MTISRPQNVLLNFHYKKCLKSYEQKIKQVKLCPSSITYNVQNPHVENRDTLYVISNISIFNNGCSS